MLNWKEREMGKKAFNFEAQFLNLQLEGCNKVYLASVSILVYFWLISINCFWIFCNVAPGKCVDFLVGRMGGWKQESLNKKITKLGGGSTPTKCGQAEVSHKGGTEQQPRMRMGEITSSQFFFPWLEHEDVRDVSYPSQLAIQQAASCGWGGRSHGSISPIFLGFTMQVWGDKE